VLRTIAPALLGGAHPASMPRRFVELCCPTRPPPRPCASRRCCQGQPRPPPTAPSQHSQEGRQGVALPRPTPPRHRATGGALQNLSHSRQQFAGTPPNRGGQQRCQAHWPGTTPVWSRGAFQGCKLCERLAVVLPPHCPGGWRPSLPRTSRQCLRCKRACVACVGNDFRGKWACPLPCISPTTQPRVPDWLPPRTQPKRPPMRCCAATPDGVAAWPYKWHCSECGGAPRPHFLIPRWPSAGRSARGPFASVFLGLPPADLMYEGGAGGGLRMLVEWACLMGWRGVLGVVPWSLMGIRAWLVGIGSSGVVFVRRGGGRVWGCC